MNTYLKTDARGVHEVSLAASLLQKRIIIIHGEITSQLADEFLQALLVLTQENSAEPIKVLITTNGGDVNAGMLIYDAIISCPCLVYTYALDRVYSMGAIILCAGTKIYMFPHSNIMIHRPQTGVHGLTDDLMHCTDTLQYYESLFISIFSKRTGLSKEEMKTAISYDHYYSAQEALDSHLIDAIVGMDHIVEMRNNYEEI